MPDTVRDLFGRELTPEEARRVMRSPRQPRKSAYAAPPGSGPDGKRCKDCKHARTTAFHSSKVYWKCGLVVSTRGAGTDIRVRAPACKRFEEKPVDA
jgi:hypothetical protein